MTFAAVAASLLILAVACDEPAPVEPAAPVFPELVENYAVAPGDTLELTFTPNMDWEVSVPEDTMDFFWIIDDSFQYSKISGKASEEAVTVKIGVSEKTDFVNRATTVRLTMGGETRIIAKYMRPAAGKSIQLYTCQVDENGAWIFAEDGSYSYGSEEADTVKLVYTGSDMRLPIKVVSNFDYSISMPEWARADIPELKVGSKEFIVYGVPSKYPLDDAFGTIEIRSGEEVVKKYVIMIPGCGDIFSFGVNLVTTLDFNENASFLTALGYMDGPVEGWVNGSSNVNIVAFEKKNDKYSLSSVNPKWLHVELAPYDDSEGADILQKRDIKISVDPLDNDQDMREAIIFILPKVVRNNTTLFTRDYSSPAEMYSGNVLTLIQKEVGFISLETSSLCSLESIGGLFELSKDSEVNTIFDVRYVYGLRYVDSSISPSYARLIFLSEVDSYKVFDTEFTEIDLNSEDAEESQSGWSVEISEDTKGAVISMPADKKGLVGYVAFYDKDGNAMAVVTCTYDTSKYIVPEFDVEFIGYSVTEAAQVGATLEQVTNESDEQLYKEIMAGVSYALYPPKIYILTYTVENKPQRISLPENLVHYHTVNPYAMKDYIRVNDIVYDAEVEGLEYMGVKIEDGGVTIHMDMPDNHESRRIEGNIYFTDTVSQTNTVIVLYCILDLTK